MSDHPQQCYPKSAPAPGEAELGSKPFMASQIQLLSLWHLEGLEGRLLSSKWEGGVPTVQVGLEAAKVTRSGLRWGWTGRAEPRIPGGLLGTHEPSPAQFVGCGQAGPQETGCWLFLTGFLVV